MRDHDASRAGRASPSALERSKRQVKLDLAKFAVVNFFLAILALATHGRWFLWVFLGWGMVVVLKAVRVLVLHEPLEPKRKKREAKEFDRKVDEGASLLLETTKSRGSRVRIATDDADVEREALAEAEAAQAQRSASVR